MSICIGRDRPLQCRYSKELGVDSMLNFSDGALILPSCNMSDICVTSSIRECFGLNIVEAMYCGLPVVASNNSGHSSIINDGVNGFIVEHKDTDAFA